MPLTTLATLKAELGISDNSQDAYLTALLAQQSAAVEAYCSRVFGRRAVTDTFRSDVRRARLVLSARPVISVTSVTEAGTVLTAADYEADSAAGLLLRLDGADGPSCWAAGKTVVVYQAGYVLPGEPSPDLPADIERACIDLCVRAHAAKGRDPALRSYQNPDVESLSYFDPDKTELRGGLPADIAGRLDPHRTVHF